MTWYVAPVANCTVLPFIRIQAGAQASAIARPVLNNVLSYWLILIPYSI